MTRLICAALAAVPIAASAATPTWNEVAPIVYARCAGCHHDGDIAPMSLLTYKEARPWAKAIRQAVATRRMPPWHADPHFGSFVNDRRLSDAEIATIQAWAEHGAPEGDASAAPKPPTFTEGWHGGKPDVVVPIPSDYKVVANGPDAYLYFQVPNAFAEDTWVQSVELRPGNRKVVHHAHVYLKAKPAPASEKKADGPKFTFKDGALTHINPEMPVMDDGCSQADGGYWPGKKPGENSSMLGSYLPGKEPDVFPAGYARKIPAGATLEFQVHYHPTKNDEIDRTSVGFILAKELPKQPLRRIDISNFLFQIPAGDPNHVVTACYTFPKDVNLTSYTAHMHLRGKAMKFEAVSPSGERRTLLDVPRYDFNWQTEYKLARPEPIAAGTRIVITAKFDNSAANPANPDPTKPVRWGEPSYEEMMDGWLEYTLP